MKYKVLREHLGDRPYAEGDMREANAVDVTHLVQNGILKEMSEEEVAAHLAAQSEPSGDPDGGAASDPKAEAPEKPAFDSRRTKAAPAAAAAETSTDGAA